jgi:hypothetical protein
VRKLREKTKIIHISGRRWFDRKNGNTYFSSSIYVNGVLVERIPYEYGYGEQYLRDSMKLLINKGYLPRATYAEQRGIRFTTEVADVARKSDL